jgi:hypothetical protein
VLGGVYDEAAPYAYRVGYCPAVVEGGFLVQTAIGWNVLPDTR